MIILELDQTEMLYLQLFWKTDDTEAAEENDGKLLIQVMPQTARRKKIQAEEDT